MYATAITVPAQMVYMKIPSRVLYDFVDGLFPSLDKFPIADAVRGYDHRYKYGHDLLVDVPRTFTMHGPVDGMKHIGHILLTDFSTKAGIPIPGLSQSGLGSFLEQAGIHRGWLNVSLFDGGVGILCVAEGASDLAQALAGNLGINWETFFDTYVEGAIEIALSLASKVQNPILLVGGIQNVLAGIVSTWNELSVYVDPLDFFGSAGVSAFIGFTIAYGLLGEDLSNASADALRSGMIGAMYALSPSFGFGMIAGFASFRLGSIVATKHNRAKSALLTINREAYKLLVEEVCRGKLPVQSLLERATPQVKLQRKSVALATNSCLVRYNAKILSEECSTLQIEGSRLNTDALPLNGGLLKLSADQRVLNDLYCAALADFNA